MISLSVLTLIRVENGWSEKCYVEQSRFLVLTSSVNDLAHLCGKRLSEAPL